METAFSVQGHPTTDMLEEYAFRRLPEVDAEAVEEHLLVCPECQTSLADVDDYILLMKHATARSRLSLHSAPAARNFWGFSFGWRYSFAAAALVACVGLGLTIRSMAPASDAKSLEFQKVQLVALRGGGDEPAVNHARPGRPLDLSMDITGLPAAATYRIEIVDAGGHSRWNGSAAESQDSLSVHVPEGFEAGQYWVRLYSTGLLQREFGLKVE